MLGRFAAPARHRTFWLTLGAAAVAAELVALLPIVVADESTLGYRAVFRLVGGVFAACGLIAWRRRPIVAAGCLWSRRVGLLVEPVFVQLEPASVRTVGDLFEDALGIPIIALLLTFMSGGRLRPERTESWSACSCSRSCSSSRRIWSSCARATSS